ncbi:MAG: glycosyltransferase [Roseibium sp.]|uniref:glycosyltransferase n=1 Tax=Roseibium sp. TaxID=1936156 RepID=UPI00261206AF|nr:glycosyltransferase [Roseibium sp.]MCV0428444.1 glycosyltransferase [Roseibium sp.]
MKVAILCHTAHFKSGSFKWVKEALSQKGVDASLFAINADRWVLHELNKDNVDLVICVQSDLVAAWFLSRGVPAVCMPMADGCGNMPDIYFALSGMLGSISMTDFIATKMERVRNTSYRMRYYNKPGDQKKVLAKDRGIDVFYGHRTTMWREVNNLRNSLKQCGLRLHTHLMLDDPLETPDIRYNTTYFADRSELDDVLYDSKFFLCPRISEGIGFSTIHAMEHGCVPIAVDGPGNAEYIDDGATGIVVSPAAATDNALEDIISRLVGIRLPEIRQNIYKQSEIGYELFQQKLDGFPFYLKSRREAFLAHPDRYMPLELKFIISRLRMREIIEPSHKTIRTLRFYNKFLPQGYARRVKLDKV